MITRLFRSRPRLDSSDPADRRTAIDALTEEDARKSQTVLVSLAKEDSDPGVRIAATGRLTDETALGGLLEDSALTEHAVARILQMVEQGECGRLADAPAVLAARLKTTDEPQMLIERLLDLGGSKLLIDALLGCDHKRRTALLELGLFERLDLLTELERCSRDRDKRTNRFARQRLDTIRQQAATAQTLVEAVDERLSSLAKPTTDVSEQEHKRRTVLRERIEQDLAELESLATALVSAGSPPPELAPLRARYQALEAESAPTEEPAGTDPEVSTPAIAAESGFDDLTRRFEALDTRLTSASDFEALADERQHLTEQWLTRADQTPPPEHQHAVFEQVSHRFQELAGAQDRLHKARFPDMDLAAIPEAINENTPEQAWRTAEQANGSFKQLARALETIAWPDWAPTPERLTEQRQRLDEARQRLSAWERLVEQTLQGLEQKLTGLETHIEAGELQAARSEAGDIRRRLKPLPEHRASGLNRQLARASARLGELSDWQTFATSPKREALLANMEEIAQMPLPAADQAQRIKALRKEWNALGSIGRSEDRKLLEAFNEAAERAFEPCRVHFEAQAAIRAENLAAREAICESLAQYMTATDWSDTDYRAAERIMRTARDEWRAHHPVDRTAGKAVEGRFEALQAELHQHIKAEWERNLAAKQQIVSEAQALAGSDEDVREKVEGAKRLQQQWKTIGTTPRRPDQTLWREFRAACDAIFDSRDSARRSEDATIEANREAIERLLAEFRARMDDTSTELDAGDLRTFQRQFNELPAVPDRLARPLERERDELVRAAEQFLRDQRAAETMSRLTNLKSQDEAVSILEQKQLSGETVAFTAPDPVFQGRCTPGAEPVSAEALTRVVIEAEIAAGLESRETDQRMSIQVELMNSGRGREALDATPEALTRRWCELGPKTSDTDLLRDRFFQAIGTLLER